MTGRHRSEARWRGARSLLSDVPALLLALALFLLAFALFAREANGGPEAGASAATKDVQTGHYHGGGFPSTPVDFGVSADRRRIKNFKTRAKLDCKQGGFFVGYFVFRKILIDRMGIQRSASGGRFAKTLRGRFRGGGRYRIRVRGNLIAPERARGRIRARVSLPQNVECRQVFGPVGWTARYVG
jgi:hypothetical protein